MTTKTKVIVAVISLATAYGFGRWSAPEKIKIETKTVTVEVTTEKKETDKDTHKKTTVKEVTKPDGSKEKITEIVEDTTTKTKTKSKDKVSEVTESVTEKTYSTSKVTVLALAGVPITGGLPDFGLSVSKPILGPISISIGMFKSGLIFGGLGLTL